MSVLDALGFDALDLTLREAEETSGDEAGNNIV